MAQGKEEGSWQPTRSTSREVYPPVLTSANQGRLGRQS